MSASRWWWQALPARSPIAAEVAPFKPQNMSNNAAVTEDGGEIGRAQALQARAARMPLTVHMNPVLLKPQSEVGAQIVVQGRVWATAKAAEYQGIKPQLMPAVMDSFARMKAGGRHRAGRRRGQRVGNQSAGQRHRQYGFRRGGDVPVVLIGDIDRGGVIASLVGTKHVVDPADAARIVGFIVNRFRGDPALFADGMAEIARLTGWQAFGLLPFFAMPQSCRRKTRWR
jgi:adenosylcobyric acid synthase